MRKEKKCPQCNASKPLSEFVASYGHFNPRGKYCSACYHEREQEDIQNILLNEWRYIRYLKDRHANDWEKFARPHWLDYTLFQERSYCPYCTKPLGPKEDREPNGRVIKKHNHIDHMDPLELGGEDSIRNSVYCCWQCNLRKGVLPFLTWISRLAEPQRNEMREIYESKHGRSPECFTIGKPTPRVSMAGTCILLPDQYQMLENP
jgi:hypothetical protein